MEIDQPGAEFGIVVVYLVAFPVMRYVGPHKHKIPHLESSYTVADISRAGVLYLEVQFILLVIVVTVQCMRHFRIVGNERFFQRFSFLMEVDLLL